MAKKKTAARKKTRRASAKRSVSMRADEFMTQLADAIIKGLKQVIETNNQRLASLEAAVQGLGTRLGPERSAE